MNRSLGLAVEVTGVGKRFRRQRDRRATLKELVVRGPSRHVDDFWALRNVSLTIPRGSVYGLIGHNGSGKSTLLKVLAGIYRPNEGGVTVNGRLAALIELGAGFHPELTGRENIRLNGSILGLTRKDVGAATDEIIEFSGLGDFIDEPIKNYSSGMYVRLGFSVAVHMRPDVLLIDEVIAVGDEDFQRKCFDHLYALRKSGRTIIVVSHSTTMMASLCDEVAWLDHGQLMSVGPAEDVIDGYLASVNATEGSGPVQSRETALDDARRTGTGEARLSAVELLGSDGLPTTSCVAGASLRIRLAFHALEEITDPVFALAIRHESGPLVTVVSTRVTGDHVGRLFGVGVVDYLQQTCSLNPGNYQVDVSILDHTGTYAFDAWTDALTLVVRQGQGIARGGLVSLTDGFDVLNANSSRPLPDSSPYGSGRIG